MNLKQRVTPGIRWKKKRNQKGKRWLKNYRKQEKLLCVLHKLYRKAHSAQRRQFISRPVQKIYFSLYLSFIRLTLSLFYTGKHTYARANVILAQPIHHRRNFCRLYFFQHFFDSRRGKKKGTVTYPFSLQQQMKNCGSLRKASTGSLRFCQKK